MIDPSQLHRRGEGLIAEAAQLSEDLKKLQEMIGILTAGFNFFDKKGRDEQLDVRAGEYPYIPYDLGMFLEVFMELKDILAKDPHYRVRDPKLAHRKLKFLEVGCGVGRNLFLLKHAESLRYKTVHGIEIVPRYVELARQFYHLEENVFQADAMQFDYSSYDIVYFYRPFSEEKLERRFELRVLRHLKPGAYVVSGLGLVITKPKDMEPTDSFRIWRKDLPARVNGSTKTTRETKTRKGH
jgi:SAM-dependent methyltransferase